MGDILVWNESLGCAWNFPTMGIRVDEDTLRRQVALEERRSSRAGMA